MSKQALDRRLSRKPRAACIMTDRHERRAGPAGGAGVIRVEWVRLEDFKCFADTGEVSLGPINVLVGENNAGKSAFLQGIRGFQVGGSENAAARLGSPDFKVSAEFSGPDTRLFGKDDDLPEFRKTRDRPL